ncbi:MAG: TonB-dependent receptor, partial [Acidobacteria bacterium]|nr:TonB-dependent receptor [Acidobacteriota bacterium]
MLRIAIAVLLSISGYAQSTDAIISGSVIDPSGAGIAGSRVIARNTQTGVVSESETNAAGGYVFPALQPGTYQISADHTGFRKYVINELEVEVGAKLSLNLSLEIGAAAEVIEVRAEAVQQLAYLSASVGTVISGKRVLELPLAGRNAMDLLKTQAGVTGANGGQNFNGARVGSLNISVDGTNAQDNLLNSLFLATVSSGISVDRIEEFRIVTSPADAELGRGSGQIQALTRSGTNTFHGSLFEEHRDRSLNANSFFNNQRGQGRDRLIRNFFGGRVGGPIRKNRTFFNFFYERRYERFSQTVTSTVLT